MISGGVVETGKTSLGNSEGWLFGANTLNWRRQGNCAEARTTFVE